MENSYSDIIYMIRSGEINNLRISETDHKNSFIYLRIEANLAAMGEADAC
jgi:hypothetical protein